MTSEQERAAYRAFVRAHHPDRGGDPDEFVAGLARLRAGAPDSGDAARDTQDPPVDAADLPFPLRVAVAVVRTVRRQRRGDVDPPPPEQPRSTP